MRVELVVPERAEPGEDFAVRAILLNDSFEPVEVWRNAFVGPTATPAGSGPVPQAVEPTFGQPEQPLLLQPFAFYGRERRAGGFSAGVVVITAHYRPEGAEPISQSREIVIG